MKIRIAINTSYGGNYLPEFIVNQIDNNKNRRMEIARILDSLEMNVQNITEDYEDFKKGEKSYLKFENDTVVFHKRKHLIGPTWKVCNVDTDIPWKIDDYDGSEYIEIFEGVKVIDEETGECEW